MMFLGKFKFKIIKDFERSRILGFNTTNSIVEEQIQLDLSYNVVAHLYKD
jgi:hypothetical protein